MRGKNSWKWAKCHRSNQGQWKLTKTASFYINYVVLTVSLGSHSLAVNSFLLQFLVLLQGIYPCLCLNILYPKYKILPQTVNTTFHQNTLLQMIYLKNVLFHFRYPSTLLPRKRNVVRSRNAPCNEHIERTFCRCSLLCRYNIKPSSTFHSKNSFHI